MLPFNYSTIVSVVYFVINVIFLILLGVIVYKQGKYETMKSKSYLKDIWSQRKIFAPFIIVFYDTATDIGVIYNWYWLMQQEQNNPDVDYKSVDMTIFFWAGIGILIAYRIFMFMLAAYYCCCDGDGEWYYLLLVLLDLFVFVAVYESFSEAQGVITDNANKRKRNQQRKKNAALKKKMEQMHDIQMQDVKDVKMDTDQTKEKPKDAKNLEQETKIVSSEIKHPLQIVEEKEEDEEEEDEEEEEEEKEIEPADLQHLLQMLESITESMPQIVLQSVFIIRSANDKSLVAAGSNLYLVMFSIIASLLSIASKFIFADKENFVDRAKSLKPKLRFPMCCQYWYISRVLWKVSHVISRFVIFTLIWVVMGGAWLPIWIAIIYVMWVIYLMNDPIDNHSFGGSLVGAIALMVVLFGGAKNDLPGYIVKFVESLIALCVITVFGTFTFQCGICSDATTRTLFNGSNSRVLIFWILGVVATSFDIGLFCIFYIKDIIQ